MTYEKILRQGLGSYVDSLEFGRNWIEFYFSAVHVLQKWWLHTFMCMVHWHKFGRHASSNSPELSSNALQ